MTDKAWFAPRRFGYGAGWPIAWQGWAVVAIYLSAVLAAALLLGEAHPVATLCVVTLATAALAAIAAPRTQGGWRWRWGA